MMADITPLGLLTVRVYADDLGRGLVDLGKILIAAGRTPLAGPRGPSSQWTLSWSKPDSNSRSHPLTRSRSLGGAGASGSARQDRRRHREARTAVCSRRPTWRPSSGHGVRD